MNTPELQSKILDNTKQLSTLASAIDKLPESETRGELIYKATKVLQRLTDLHVELGYTDENACYYGFTDKCPGHHCADCEYWKLGGS